MPADRGTVRASDQSLAVDAVGRVSLRLYRLGSQSIPGRFCSDALRLIADAADLAGLRWLYGKRADPTLLASLGTETASPARVRIRLHEFLIDGGVDGTVKRLLPHAVNAWSVNQRVHGLTPAPRNGSTEAKGHALVDENGKLLEADERFTALLGDEHGAVGRELPFAIHWSDRLREHGLLFRGVHVAVTRRGRGFHLFAKPDQRYDPLTRREWQVIAEVARGRTYAQVGDSLSMSASTVATHVHAVYRKLDISRRDALGLAGHPFHQRVPDEA